MFSGLNLKAVITRMESRLCQVGLCNASGVVNFSEHIVSFPDPEHTREKGVWGQYDSQLDPMTLMSGMWDGQSEFSKSNKLLCSFRVG